MNAPRTYAEWLTILENIKDIPINDEIVNTIQSGVIEGEGQFVGKIIIKFHEVVEYRINNIKGLFESHQSRPSFNENDLVAMLLLLKNEFKRLLQIVSIDCIPENDRNKLIQVIRNSADNTQQALETSAQYDTLGKIASIIRNNKVNSI